jgi:hypothetical protein
MAVRNLSRSSGVEMVPHPSTRMGKEMVGETNLTQEIAEV